MSQRTDRLDSQIQQELMQLLQRDLKDPRVGFATITRVEALSSATPWLRRQLGERLRLRHVPQLSIRADDSIESGDRVLRILRDIEADTATKDGS